MLRILFSPMPLIECQKLYWLQRLGVFKMVNHDPDLVFRWEYAMTQFQDLKNIWGVPIVNENCLDVSKTWVDRIFEEVYGYSTEVKEGIAVEKANLTNGLKDVRVVDLSKQEKKKDYFYQRLLKSKENIETRLVVMNSKVVYRLDKIKQFNDIIGKVVDYKIVPVKEDEKVDKFCQLLGLDYGELDLIEGVIIDVNPTPGDTAFVRLESFIKDYCKLFKRHYG